MNRAARYNDGDDMTDKLIEAVARAMHTKEWEKSGKPPAFNKNLADYEYWADSARAALKAIENSGHVVVPAWKPIETAPMDGTRILVWRPFEDKDWPAHHGIDRWSETFRSWWNSRRDQQPTHWMPLPSPPDREVK